MTTKATADLDQKQIQELLKIIKERFEANMPRHPDSKWDNLEKKLIANPNKLWSLNQMEITGGEPDVIAYNNQVDEYLFFDCSVESPKGRRSTCYDREALDARKEYKPKHNAIEMASDMGIELLNEDQYKQLQTFGNFDTKTSSWLKTPSEIRALGGAIFADFRYGKTFVYHNGAQSYYAGRGFRGSLTI